MKASTVISSTAKSTPQPPSSLRQTTLLAAFGPPTKKAKSTTTTTTTTAATMEPTKHKTKQTNQSFKVFCDLDGVLVDFEKGYQDLLGKDFRPDDKPRQRLLWATIGKTPHFYERLPWTTDGPLLWQTIHHLQPDILTGVAMFKSCRKDKFRWCQRELPKVLPPETQNLPLNHVDMAALRPQRHQCIQGSKRQNVCNVITCWSKFKHHESGHQCVLIDDRINLQSDWEKAGGIFIHHTDTESTLQQLRDRGILQSQPK